VPLRVIGPRVLVQPLEHQGIGHDDLTFNFGGVTFKPTQQTSAGILIAGRSTSLSVGTVIDVGTDRCPDCEQKHDFGVKVGDVVLTSRLSGQEISQDGQQYWVIAIADILSVYEPELEPVHV
jgi:co-chaperonin GroES (HSP10)